MLESDCLCERTCACAYIVCELVRVRMCLCVRVQLCTCSCVELTLCFFPQQLRKAADGSMIAKVADVGISRALILADNMRTQFINLFYISEICCCY